MQHIRVASGTRSHRLATERYRFFACRGTSPLALKKYHLRYFFMRVLMNFYLFILVAEKFIFGHSFSKFIYSLSHHKFTKKTSPLALKKYHLRYFFMREPTLPWQYGFEPNGHQYKKNTHKGCFFCIGDPNGTRTHIATVKG